MGEKGSPSANTRSRPRQNAGLWTSQQSPEKGPPAPGCFRTTTAQLLPSGRWQEAVGTARCSTRLAPACPPRLCSRFSTPEPSTSPPSPHPLPSSPSLWPQLCKTHFSLPGRCAPQPHGGNRIALGERGPGRAERGAQNPGGACSWLTYREPVSLKIWSCSGLESSVTPLTGHLKPHPSHCDLELALPPQA